MKNTLLSNIFLFLILLSGCGEGEESTPEPDYVPEVLEYSVESSRLNLPIQIPLNELQKAINANVPTPLISNKPLKGRFVMNAKRNGNVRMRGKNKTIIWNVPIEIEVVNDKNGHVVSKFEVVPSFESLIKIEKDYTLSAKSKLVDLTFSDEATINMLGVKIGVTKLISKQIKKHASSITEKLDDEINKVSIEKLLEKTWTKLRSPIRVNKKLVNIYLLGEPESIVFHEYHFENNNMMLDFTLIAVLNTIYDSASYVPMEFDYPPLSIAPKKEDGFDLHLAFPITYRLIDSLANLMLTGKEFDVEGEKIYIDSIHVSARDSVLLIYAKMMGDWAAEMNAVGVPAFDAQTKMVFVNGFDFSFSEESSSLFHATDYLFHEEIQNEVLAKLRFNVGPLIDSLPEMLYGAIEKGKSGDNINLTTHIDSAVVSDVLIGQDKLVILLDGKGDASLEIEKLKKK